MVPLNSRYCFSARSFITLHRSGLPVNTAARQSAKPCFSRSPQQAVEKHQRPGFPRGASP